MLAELCMLNCMHYPASTRGQQLLAVAIPVSPRASAPWPAGRLCERSTWRRTASRASSRCGWSRSWQRRLCRCWPSWMCAPSQCPMYKEGQTLHVPLRRHLTVTAYDMAQAIAKRPRHSQCQANLMRVRQCTLLHRRPGSVAIAARMGKHGRLA
jgi:hypothetical protein